ncbi:MAG: 2,3,4,5-tetrahydropyridine-2-carboxylate N-succinyltransferase [Pseudohongiellaceae bacterium]|jgi:2,3,4,5-tetrahydropyridine-2-carboxylate N-succinyltransferase
MSNLHSFAIGIATQNSKHEVIEVFYPAPRLAPSQSIHKALSDVLGLEPSKTFAALITADTAKLLADKFQAITDSDLSSEVSLLQSASSSLLVCVIAEDSAPQSIAEVFLKLHLLSHRLVKPHGINLEGMFGLLKNLAWTNKGPVELDELPAAQVKARLNGELLSVNSVDKFPCMTNYVVPSGVRIADTARVRLGAYIGAGTTVMHEGFVNFNAGTIGPAMIEGRISAGVLVGANSDLGGGCSTMGTLSGGGKEIISVGEHCLIGANAGIGFPLADGCIVEAGLYVTAGTKVKMLDSNGSLVDTKKALELSKQPDLLFRRNSINGAVECVPLKQSISLNEELHAHN